MKKIALVGSVFLASMGWYVEAQAQVAYDDSALKGCYAYRGTSVDTGSSDTAGKDTVGTLCFDGNGHIVGTSATPSLSGHVANYNGKRTATPDETGSYHVTNDPGDGMGYFETKCTFHAFVLRNVDSSGLAHGFNYILTKLKPGCNDGGILVSGGGGELQGPLK